MGARFDDVTLLHTMPLQLRAKLAWTHDWASDPALNATFDLLSNASFSVSGAPFPPDSALTSVGAELLVMPNWSFLAEFEGEFAAGSLTYAGSGTLRHAL